MSSEYDPDDAHYDDPGYDAYWHGYNHGHRDGYDKGTCCIINIIILSTMTIIISSEGALIAITPYDYPRAHFLSTHRSSTKT